MLSRNQTTSFSLNLWTMTLGEPTLPYISFLSTCACFLWVYIQFQLLTRFLLLFGSGIDCHDPGGYNNVISLINSVGRACVWNESKCTVCACVCARGVQQGWMLGPVHLSTASILRLDYSQIWLLAWRHDLGCSYSYVNGWRAQSEYHRRELFRIRPP